ncbi:DUF2161 family putative PD-(D/E)XK-type phosphodiesterase [Pseudooceanicola sp.]|uniref:DUF2161 domain-containing phosphodiesterase n=1 Tax=Pseudooceanicola sp. TaxID=1914328 RepID=UPI00262DC86F|nr:DUF2161 family putative PD-(D/E)XK-type phosphodiesterase [Pseudooceanicola sp.]MDF1854449.1 DUF2161 family putative PD-(D/E)XK-type phosphodiesterase [Pseudooceanicola sp.]
MAKHRITQKETDLYAPVKAWLEARGYVVKGEVGAADVMALAPDTPDEPLLIELKTGFTLSLLHQGVARQSISDLVYLAVPKPKKGRKALAAEVALCRRLGLGLIHVRPGDGQVEVLCDPGPYSPRKSKPRKQRLLREWARRAGDPNDGGATRHGIVTSYRQDALRCAQYLAVAGAERGSIVAKSAGVPTATRIMADDHYGWFERVERGVYRLTIAGRQGLKDWGDALPDKE